MRPKHVPQRTCIACRTTGEKQGLLRVVRTPDGVAVFDSSGKTNGRGAYVCASEVCILAARKARKLERGLKCDVAAEVYDALLAKAKPTTPTPEP
ncbi:MAG: YlxR family protein [Chthonomonadales bacterium]